MNSKRSKSNKIQEELAQMTELAKRTMADLQNLKRRQEQEKVAWVKMANADLISALLPILDNLQLALKHIPKEATEHESTTKWTQGIQMSINQCQKIFEETGLQTIETVGQPFNPNLHEALAQDPGEKNIILEEIEKGYMLGDRVLRHAKVKVGNGK
jgi:molecular chaperone GrpE